MKSKAKKFTEGPVDKSKCNHTPGADDPGYIRWHAWAEEMSKTHKQTQCPNCGFWYCWVLKQ